MLKDFNIANEAGGVGKLTIKNFTAHVISGSLKMRFHWAGKGTVAIPYKSVYGPLISAISVTSGVFLLSLSIYSFLASNFLVLSDAYVLYNYQIDFEPPRIIPGSVIAAIVAAGVGIVILILGILWWRGFLRKRNSLEIGNDKVLLYILEGPA